MSDEAHRTEVDLEDTAARMRRYKRERDAIRTRSDLTDRQTFWAGVFILALCALTLVAKLAGWIG